MFPAFRVQNTLQEKTLGKAFWKKHSKRQVQLKSGEVVTVARYKDLKYHYAHETRTTKMSGKSKRKSSKANGATDSEKVDKKKKGTKKETTPKKGSKPKAPSEEEFASIGI